MVATIVRSEEIAKKTLINLTDNMKFHAILILAILSFAACTKTNNSGEWIKAEVFLNPPVDYRSAPFYSLNDKLDTTELIRQLKSFKEGVVTSTRVPFSYFLLKFQAPVS